MLVTGGAGFVGSSLSIALARSGHAVVALDSLRRRGSELNRARLRDAGVEFVHGDVRIPDDLEASGEIDAVVECSAEPSVLAGRDGDSSFVVQTNLVGAHHCLELARRRDAQLVFLSTSRVYPVQPLNALAYRESETRFELDDEQSSPGASARGISEAFPLAGARTLYGATKLAAELLIAEYAEDLRVRAVVNRCGVIAGPWQMGKVDQGVFTHWLLSHYTKKGLRYIGYGGHGKQVRDVLHINDLVELVEDQLERPDHWAGVTVNVGGTRDFSLSLLEATAICAEVTGNRVPVDGDAENRPGDVPVYISNCERLFGLTEWRPRRRPREVIEDIYHWVHDNERAVLGALAPA